MLFLQSMHSFNKSSSNKAVAIWLLIGVGMIVVQVLLGGITRLTQSGLSITEWKPITGILPPLNDISWQAEFDKYKTTDQFRYVHQHFSLSDFKFIFFWEWFHRVWARMMGMVFLIGFVYFFVKKKFNQSMILPMALLFFLGAIQGVIGWFMVKSGLVPEKYFVGHIELTTHLLAAFGLLCYTLWFALSLLIPSSQKIKNNGLKNFLLIILIVLIFQLMYGGFMAGLRAGAVAPTWPDINGSLIPNGMGNSEFSFVQNITSNPIAVHFIHRGLAYLLFLLIAVWWFKSTKYANNSLINIFRNSLFGIVVLQVCLGILTVLNATNTNHLIWFGVAHQFTGMLLLITVICLNFLVLRDKNIS